MFVCLGAAEFGQFFFIRNAFQSAARDAARASCLDTAQQADPATVAARTLAQADVAFSPVWLTILDLSNGNSTVTDVSQIPIGHTFQVSVGVAYGQIPNVYRPMSAMTGVGVSSSKPCIGQCTMVKD